MRFLDDQMKGQLEALLRQECNHYQCVDYTTITEQPRKQQQNDEASICSTAQLQPPSTSSSKSIISSSSSSANHSILSSSEQGMIRMMPNNNNNNNNKPEVDLLIHLLEECAFLVTDMRYMKDQSSSSRHSSSSTKRQEEAAAASAAADSSLSSSSCSLKRVGSMVSFNGIHEETAAAVLHQQQQRHAEHHEHLQQQQQQQQPSGEDLAYWRRQMMEWAFLVVKSFEMDREVVAVAFNLLDRYVPLEMSRGAVVASGCGSSGIVSSTSGSGSNDGAATAIMLPPITRDDYQLYAMTCLYTAVKIHEPYPRKLAVEALVAMSRDFYTVHDVICTELDILKALQWHVNPPTAMTFARYFVNALLLLPQSSSSSSSSAPPSSTASPTSVIRSFVQMDPQDAACSNHDGALASLHQQDKDELYALCAKITEVALARPFFLSFPNSTIGLAAVLHAVRSLQERSSNKSVVAAVSASLCCKALLKALKTARIMSTTTTTTTTTSSTSGAATTVGEVEHVKLNQISGSELEVVYSRLETLLLSS